MIRDVLRGDFQASLDQQFGASLSKALADEPQWDLPSGHIAAPASDPQPRTGADNIINFAAIKRKPIRTLAGLTALAASVALAAVLVSAPRFEGARIAPEQVAGADSEAAPSNRAGAPRVSPVSDDSLSVSPEMAELLARLAQRPQTGLQQAGIRWNTSQQVERRLNNYLLNHSEYISTSPRGMMPYARIVGYERRERFQ